MANTGIYTSFKSGLFNGIFNITGHTIKAALMKSGFTFNSANTKWSDISAQEVTGINYTPGGETLSGKTITTLSQMAVFKASNVTWFSSTITSYAVVLYDATATNSPLICSFDFGSAQSSTNGNFTITWSTSGIITLS